MFHFRSNTIIRPKFGAAIASFRNKSTLIPTINELFRNPPEDGSMLSAKGHIKAIRQFKKVGFIDISDGTTSQSLSIVFKDPSSVLDSSSFLLGQSISVYGKWVKSTGKQNFEIEYKPERETDEIKVLGEVPLDYPLQKKSLSYSYLRTLPVLRHRTATLAAVARMRSFAEYALMNFFMERSFTKVSPPIITGNDCEGAGEQFSLAAPGDDFSSADNSKLFFDKPAYLTVSTQLHLEVLAQSLTRVWTLTPCFRAENSKTNRHLSEFWMLEAEITYANDVTQLTSFVEDMIKFVTKQIIDPHSSYPGNGADLSASRYNDSERMQLQSRWESISSTEQWPSITYSEAITVINNNLLKNEPSKMKWGDTIQTVHEKWLTDFYNSPVFVTDYPACQKPFYMSKSHASIYNKERPTVACFDLLFPYIGELVGGSLRESDYDSLVANMDKLGMNKSDMQWYLDTRVNGSVEHGGFGMGFERLMCFLTMMDNIREVIAFPRSPQACSC